VFFQKAVIDGVRLRLGLDLDYRRVRLGGEAPPLGNEDVRTAPWTKQDDWAVFSFIYGIG